MPSPATGPIIIIEDDEDDQELLTEVFQHLEIQNELKFFENATEVLQYLRTTSEQPFIIITDVNLPGLTGVELRAEIIKDEYLRRKSVPFVFLTTSNSKLAIDKAYELQVQGYFQKPSSIQQIQSMIKMIMDYWKVCLHPNA